MSARKPAVKTTATPNEIRIAGILRNHKTHIEALEQRIKELQAPKRTWLDHGRRWSGVAALVLALIALGLAENNKPREIRKATAADINELLGADSLLPVITSQEQYEALPIGTRFRDSKGVIGVRPALVATPAPRKSRSRPAVEPAAAGQPASSAVQEAVPSAPPVAAPVPVPDPAGATP